MKTLMHEKGGLMGKFLINQIALSLFGFMMSATALVMGRSWLLPLGLFGLLFYYFILFTFIHEDGLKDAIRIDGGRMKRDPLLSLKYCGIAAVPGFLIALLNAILRLSGVTGKAIEATYSILDTITRFLTYGMYNALDNYFFTNGSDTDFYRAFFSSSGLSFVCYTFLTLAVCVFAYNLGLKKITIGNTDKNQK